MQALDVKLTALKQSLESTLLHPTEQKKASLLSGIAVLDQALAGSIQPGTLIEWGSPPGKRGREILLQFLAKAGTLGLWIYGPAELSVYPPAFSAQGLALERLYFVKSSCPLRDLKPVFCEDVFALIVVDTPARCSLPDMAFLAQQARMLQQVVFIVRPYLLKAEAANPFARVRLNCCYESSQRSYQLQVLRGAKAQTLRFRWSLLAGSRLQC